MSCYFLCDFKQLRCWLSEVCFLKCGSIVLHFKQSAGYITAVPTCEIQITYYCNEKKQNLCLIFQPVLQCDSDSFLNIPYAIANRSTHLDFLLDQNSGPLFWRQKLIESDVMYETPPPPPHAWHLRCPLCTMPICSHACLRAISWRRGQRSWACFGKSQDGQIPDPYRPLRYSTGMPSLNTWPFKHV